jgi:hypothetical protein
MLDPLYGILGDARRLYRLHAARLLGVSAALFVPAGALDALITSRNWAAGWCTASDSLAAFLLLAIVAGRLPAYAAGTFELPSVPRADSTAILRSAAGAAILAGLAGAITLSEDHLGRLDFVALPAIYLAFMWLLVVPVMVTERSGPAAAARQSWRLIHGHGKELLRELAKVYLGLIAVGIVPNFIAGAPGLYPLGMRLVPILLGVGYGPFLALVPVLVYFRLTAEDQPTVAAVRETQAAASDA